ncbi:hypothetical protein PFICI_08666 [Pestalotiopsis fici W106-1]|uniref:C2H2-type domain-containing protein n=1 Tax=Pestalotiopsis fici (strain W106-1 / CGMCC3.15140) TaxID=1229662 RepID=W3WY69_PESFW|nr:uncharacterized protein PFICI_08666 [Pestalotiopsis fici W106-1]ETS78813.1 hypothetical protein PFICI_08666 [Pestalotiopsis fici W106-1]
MAHDAAIERDLREVLENFRQTSGLSHDQLQSFQNASFENIQGALAAIQQRQAQTKRLVYMKRLQPFFASMADYGKVIEVFVRASEMLAFIWITSTFSEAFTSLLETYEYLGEQLPLLSHYQELFSNQKHMRDMLVLIFKDILVFHAEGLKYFTQKVWKQLFQATWKGFNIKMQTLKDNFKRHRQLLEQRASLIEFEQIMCLRRHAEAESQERQRQTCSNRRESVLRWLASANCEAIYESLVSARSSNPKSGDWLLKDHRFQKWFDPLYCSTPLLWLNGLPGAGKSVLASVVVQNARKIPDVSTIFFHCAENDPARNNFVSVARGLLAQLVAQDEALLALVDDEKSTRSGDVILSSAVAAKRLLQVALKRKKTYIILDGLDECTSREQRKEICTWFCDIVDSLPRTQMDEIRCLFISQDDTCGRKDLGMLPTIKITFENNRHDILMFAETWQADIEAHFGRFSAEEVEIAKVVTTRSRGMFIFAKCALKEMSLQPSRDVLLQEWKNEIFPDALDGVYDKIISRILLNGSQSRRKMVQRLLAWVCCAQRPIFWHEIQGMISLDLENERLNEESKRIVGDIKDFCSSLVEIDSVGSLNMMHKTLKQYLCAKAIITPSEVHRELAEISISYLCFPQISQNLPEAQLEKEVLTGTYAFYDYATSQWTAHLLDWLPHSKSAEIIETNECLDNLLDLHFTEPTQVQVVSKTMEGQLTPLKDLDCYNSLAQLIIWNRKRQLGHNSKKNEELSDFPKITALIRSAVERLFEANTTDISRAEIHKYYGQAVFKCPHTHCHYFVRGFQNRADRDEHIERHVRAYICPIDGCPMATIGCVSQKELDKHLRENHNVGDDGDTFPDLSEESQRRSRAKNPSNHQCTLCSKSYTRAHALRSHLRTHSNERPFICTICEKAFARENDRKRHEKLHWSMKEFINEDAFK